MITAEKPTAPAYVSFKSLGTYFDQRREDGYVTDVVDKSLMSNFSGSTQSELLTALKSLKLITSSGTPTDMYRAYVLADEGKRKELMGQIIRDSYAFLFSTPGFNLERATTDQMSKLFQAQGVNGSTLYRAIAFLLSAAKFAGVKVSPNIKVPSNVRSKPRKDNGRSTGVGGAAPTQAEVDHDEEGGGDGTGKQVFYIPIPIDRKVKIEIPANWAPSDWDLFSKMLELYMEGWKQLATQNKASPKDNGPSSSDGS